MLGRDEVSLILSRLPIGVVAEVATVSSEWSLASDESLEAASVLRPVATIAGNLKLREPSYIVVTPQGEICVSESARHRILCFSRSGERRVVGGFGYGPGQFNYPKVLC